MTIRTQDTWAIATIRAGHRYMVPDPFRAPWAQFTPEALSVLPVPAAVTQPLVLPLAVRRSTALPAEAVVGAFQVVAEAVAGATLRAAVDLTSRAASAYLSSLGMCFLASLEPHPRCRHRDRYE